MATKRKVRKDEWLKNSTHIFEKGSVEGQFTSIDFFIVDGKVSSMTTFIQLSPGEVVVTTEFARQVGETYLAMKYEDACKIQGWDRIRRVEN